MSGIEVYYSTKDDPRMCFRHAVGEALKGVDVETVVDGEPGSEYHQLGRSWCMKCSDEYDESAQRSEQDARTSNEPTATPATAETTGRADAERGSTEGEPAASGMPGVSGGSGIRVGPYKHRGPKARKTDR